MNNFVATVRTSKLASTLLGTLVIGPAIAFIVYFGLNRFSDLPPSQLIPLTIAVAVLISLTALVLAAKEMVKRVELDQRRLRITKLFGAPKDYPLHNHEFSSQLTHQTTDGSYTGTTRHLIIQGPGGKQSYQLAIEAGEYNELMTRLLGPQPPAGAGVPASWAAAEQPNREPLNFQPRQFEINRKRFKRMRSFLLSLAGILAALGVAAAIYLWTQNETMGAIALLAGALIISLPIYLPVVTLQRRVAKVPQQVTVAPEWVAFDDRRFNYADLQVIQIKPPGAIMMHSAKLLTRNGEKVIIELSTRNYPDMFPNYDEFASLLYDAGTAAAGVVRFDYS